MPKVDIWSRLTPQSRAAVEKSREQYASLSPAPNTASDPLGTMRAGYNHERRYWNALQVVLPSVQDLALHTVHGRVPLRLYKPSEGHLLPVLLYSHGGGYILGNLDTHDRICRLLAQRSGWAVLAVDYTLAPEKQFPVQGEQGFAALQYLSANAASLGLDAKRIAV
ncbi:MAG: alpha/beta hydrolase fold domain-containing protein, partial [Burkholderiaceae bacterium]